MSKPTETGIDARAPALSSRGGPGLLRTPLPYRVADGVTEGLLYALVVFTPWAFGTTQEWAMWTMNVGGYLLGAALATKWVVRWRTGYRPARWGTGAHQGLVVALAILSGLIVAWCLVSAINARAVYLPRESRFEYREHYLAWLPHSYNAPSSWFAFWLYLGLACTFWATRDWLVGQARRERHASAHASSASPRGEGEVVPGVLPARLRRLLWVLCLNGALLACEGILQRLDGTNKLLWLVVPRINNTSESQFGPYAYRSNAAEYLNLVWPVCLGFWGALQLDRRGARRVTRRAGGSPHALLVPCAVLMAAGPVVSTSRGGALIAAGSMVIAITALVLASRGRRWLQLGVLGVLGAGLGLGAYLGWAQLYARFQTVFTDNLSDRTTIYTNARQMVSDYGWLGSGPKTFGPLYPLYLADAHQRLQWYAHDDWLETRITFGTLGLLLILAAWLLAAGRWFLPGGIPAPWVFAGLLGVGLGGGLLHARLDFPLQVCSVLLVFLLLTCIASTLSRTG